MTFRYKSPTIKVAGPIDYISNAFNDNKQEVIKNELNSLIQQIQGYDDPKFSQIVSNLNNVMTSVDSTVAQSQKDQVTEYKDAQGNPVDANGNPIQKPAAASVAKPAGNVTPAAPVAPKPAPINNTPAQPQNAQVNIGGKMQNMMMNPSPTEKGIFLDPNNNPYTISNGIATPKPEAQAQAAAAPVDNTGQPNPNPADVANNQPMPNPVTPPNPNQVQPQARASENNNRDDKKSIKINSNTILIKKGSLEFKDIENILVKIAKDNNITNVRKVAIEIDSENSMAQFEVSKNED